MHPISLNLTNGTSTVVDASHYLSPLFVTGDVVVCEVVFWSAKFNVWIYLVRDRTSRTFPPGYLEVSASELGQYEKQMLGIA